MPRNPNGTAELRGLLAELHRRGDIPAQPLDGPASLSPAGRRAARNFETYRQRGLAPPLLRGVPVTSAVIEHYADLLPRLAQGRDVSDATLGMFVAGRDVSDEAVRRAISQAFKVAEFRALLAELTTCKGEDERLDIIDGIANTSFGHRPEGEWSFTGAVASAFKQAAIDSDGGEPGASSRDLKLRQLTNLFLCVFGESTYDDVSYAASAGRLFGLDIDRGSGVSIDNELSGRLNGVIPRVYDVLATAPLSELQRSAAAFRPLGQLTSFLLRLAGHNVTDVMADRLTVLGAALMLTWDISPDAISSDITRMITARQS